MEENLLVTKKNGMAAILLGILSYILSFSCIAYFIYTDGESEFWGLLSIFTFIWIMIGWIIILCGFISLKPQSAVVLSRFNKYIGSIKDTDQGGLYFAPTFFTKKEYISLKYRTLKTTHQKFDGNTGVPVEIGINLIWFIDDTAKALFNVENYEKYLGNQCECALRDIYTSSDKDSVSLLNENFSNLILNKVQKKVDYAGIKIVDMGITYLASETVSIKQYSIGTR